MTAATSTAARGKSPRAAQPRPTLPAGWLWIESPAHSPGADRVNIARAARRVALARRFRALVAGR